MYDQGKVSATNCLLIDDLLLLHGNQNDLHQNANDEIKMY